MTITADHMVGDVADGVSVIAVSGNIFMLGAHLKESLRLCLLNSYLYLCMCV